MSLKVCYLMPRLLPTPSGGVVGGAAANCVSLALELSRQNVDIELLASVSEDGLAHLAGNPLSEILMPLPALGRGIVGRGFATLRTVRRGLKDRLKAKHFDVIHSHSGTYPYAFVPLVADRGTSVRLHSLYCPLAAKGGVYSAWWEKTSIAKRVFQRLDRLVAVTENVQRSVQDAGVSPEKVEVVPMCVDTQRFRPGARPEQTKYFPRVGAQARLLFVGNASKEKGLADLLLAVKILTERKIPVFLLAAVENQSNIKEYSLEYRMTQEFVHRSGLEQCVRFAGLVDSIDELYGEADIVVVPWKTSRGPSDYPMVALEAMAMGKCIVATPVGGCPELLKGGVAGMLAAGFSAEHIAATIEFVISNPEVRRGIEHMAVERAQDFSLRMSASRLIALYQRLLEGKAECDTER